MITQAVTEPGHNAIERY